MIKNKDDLYAYLIVVGHQPSLNKISAFDYERGRRALMGCFVRVMTELEKDALDSDSRYLCTAIKKREHLNAYLMRPHDDPELMEESAKLSEIIIEYLNEEGVNQVLRDQFINSLDVQLSKIIKDAFKEKK